MMNRYRVYTGPGTVLDGTADRLRDYGFIIECRGTAHIFIASEGASKDDVLRALGATWSWRDIETLASR
jgi:hypothetical protein